MRLYYNIFDKGGQGARTNLTLGIVPAIGGVMKIYGNTLTLYYAESKNLCINARGILNKTSANTSVSCAEAIIETAELLASLKNMRKEAENRINGFSFAKPDLKPDLESVNNELLQAFNALVPKTEEKLNNYSDRLKKSILSEPHKTIDELTRKNFRNKPLVSELILSLSKLPLSSRAFSLLKESANFIRKNCVRFVESGNDKESRYWGITNGLFTQAVINARQSLETGKEKNKAFVNNAIIAASILSLILTKKTLPFNLLKDNAGELLNKDIAKLQKRLPIDETPFNELFDRDNPAYFKFVDGFESGQKILRPISSNPD